MLLPRRHFFMPIIPPDLLCSVIVSPLHLKFSFLRRKSFPSSNYGLCLIPTPPLLSSATCIPDLLRLALWQRSFSRRRPGSLLLSLVCALPYGPSREFFSMGFRHLFALDPASPRIVFNTSLSPETSPSRSLKNPLPSCHRFPILVGPTPKAGPLISILP